MINDFLSWRKQNEEFINHIKHDNSIIYSRIFDVLRILDYISSIEQDKMDDDMSIIFETGYAYLFNFLNELKIYFEDYFDSNYRKLLYYEELVNFDMYLSEIKNCLIDDNIYNELIEEQFNFISSDIDSKLSLVKQGKLSLDENQKEELIKDYNERLLSVMPMDKVYQCVDEIFVNVYEAMKID